MTKPPSDAATDPSIPPTPRSAASHRSGVLQVLAGAHRPLTSAEVAAELGVHKNTVRFHLESLIDSGQVEQVEPIRSRPGRPAQAFRAVRRMDPTGPRHYELLAGVLTEALLAEPDGVPRAVAAGHAWGARAAAAITGTSDAPNAAQETDAVPETDDVPEARDRLIDLLDRFGFAPDRDERQPDERRQASVPDRSVSVQPIAVRQCPFLELATEHQRIVCGVHLGLMRGALAHWQTPVGPEVVDADRLAAEALVPFVEPDRCLVQLSLSGASGPRT